MSTPYSLIYQREMVTIELTLSSPLPLAVRVSVSLERGFCNLPRHLLQ